MATIPVNSIPLNVIDARCQPLDRSKWAARLQGDPEVPNSLDTLGRHVQNAGDEYAINELGMPPECADPVTSQQFNNRVGAFFDTSGMEPGAEEALVRELGPAIEDVYKQKLKAQVDSKHPQSPAEWEQVREDAWRITLNSPQVGSLIEGVMNGNGTTFGSAKSMLERSADLSTQAGNDLLFASTGQNFATIPRHDYHIPVHDWNSLPPERLEYYSLHLNRRLGEAYENAIRSELGNRAQPPQTQEEFDQVQDTAWREAMKSPEVLEVLSHMETEVFANANPEPVGRGQPSNYNYPPLLVSPPPP